MSRHQPILVTMRAGIRELRRPDVFDRLTACLSRLRDAGASRIVEDEFRVVHYSVQDDHMHLIVEARDRRALSRGAQGLAIRLARRVNVVTRRRGTLWPNRFHARALKTPRQVRNALVYVLQNRKKHGALAGLVDPMSSWAWLRGWGDLDDVRDAVMDFACAWEARAGPRPVARPRTWLLRRGWTRLGLLSVHEAPALRRGAGLRAPRASAR